MDLFGETNKQVKKQVPDTKSRIAFWNIYFLFSFSLHLEFLSRTLCQAGKDGTAQFEGIMGENTGAIQNCSQTVVGREGT